jgi:hypothetical protein
VAAEGSVRVWWSFENGAQQCFFGMDGKLDGSGMDGSMRDGVRGRLWGGPRAR